MNIVSLIKKYKSSVTRKYIFVSKDEIDTIPKNELFISKKIDGQLWFYCKSDKDSKIINASESEISDIIQDIKKDLDKKLKIEYFDVEGEEIISEIYYDNKKLPNQDSFTNGQSLEFDIFKS